MKAQNHIAALDGLRAVAVIAVVIFHLKASLLPGGFVGVDVFFVLSGYLMMRIIMFDKENGTYSPWRFLVRRFRRLAPALAVVSAATLIVSAYVFLPARFDAALEAALAANLYVSNFLFWQSFDYFAVDADLQPFLHTWSLGVEGQFYLALPVGIAVLGLLSVYPGGRAFAGALAAVALTSLAFSIVLTDILHKQTGAFYFPLSRFWEMLIGSLVVFIPSAWSDRIPKSIWPGLVGLSLILAPMVLLDGEGLYPGVRSIAPCVGTALLILIATRRPGPISAWLSLPPLRWIGLISFSIYLWHWPLIVLYRYGFVTDIGIMDALFIVILTLLLSHLTYRYVETPFRKAGHDAPRLRWTRRAAFAGFVVASFSLAPFVASNRANGLEDRHDALLAYETPGYSDDIESRYSYHACFLPLTADGALDEDCLAAAGKTRPSIALLGDSHAAHLLPGLKDVFPEARLLQANVAGCLPLKDISSAGGAVCTRVRHIVFNELLSRQRPDLVILSGRWSPRYADHLDQTLSHLKALGHNVAVVGPTPEYRDALPSLLVRLAGLDEADQRRQLAKNLRPGLAELDRELENKARRAGADYFSIHSLICGTGTCEIFAKGSVPFQWDYGHYTKEGSIEIVKRLEKPILRALQDDNETIDMAQSAACRKDALHSPERVGITGQCQTD